MGLFSMSEQEPEDQTPRIVACILIVLVLLLCPWLLGGCALIKGLPRIKVGQATVTAPADNGKPATLSQGETKTGIVIPQDTPVVLTKTEETPATETTAFVPAKWVYQFTPTKETRLEAVSSSVSANTGTIDTSVAMHKIDAAQRQWLLWAAIGCGVGGLVIRQLFPMWPGLSNGLLIGCPIAFAAWRFSEIPAWLFVIGVVLCGLVAAGYKRAEWDKNGNGVPDILERRQPPA